MNVLVLGANGPVGQRLCQLLHGSGRVTVVAAAPDGDPARGQVRLDPQNAGAVREAVRGMQAVVQCPDAGGAALVESTRHLVRAAVAEGCGRLVQVGSQAAYGEVEGVVDERARTGRRGGAWRAAEDLLVACGRRGGTSVLLRTGCLWGPRAGTWAERLARWLHAGRLGDLGAAGDGWSNLVHVDDVCVAVLRALQLPLQPGESRTYNLAGADSPRWNEVLIDLALATGATPVRRMRPLALRLQAWTDPLAATLLRAPPAPPASEPLTPALLALWRSQLRLDPRAAMKDLVLDWTPYPVALQEIASWWRGRQEESELEPLAVPQGS
ncbi:MULTISPECIES: NAD-dependent epimerase/dehydratase family protein [Ramlibacter]|uniref:NAD-dependent epimerase/dehydratase family protein n=1 Tax=Ramlibacter pinisoli TaxID=2682844 RepID=A0A6N8ITX7_9BURK|nr:MULTISPECIES: NAD-dependent epimerase/dehydratase family protein [Ramlibacter]MBA2964520.1 NAD-dependent epimerase/dehydratase family protein [Ramlibacter sp. CGMCC 1.13660]MVQ29486.1 NAD-dependent epimerase/dehydratase family protein [Ramlibacter pinisoli]